MKKLLSSFIAMIMMFGLPQNSMALTNLNGNFPSSNTGISLQMFCVDCESTLQMAKVCALNQKYAGSRTHKYGFLWSKTCTIDSYSSKAAQVCTQCLRTIWYEGEHHCLEIHRDCGQGEYNVCPFGGKIE